MTEGILVYNMSNDRYGIMGEDGWISSGLHCGEPLEVKVNGKWIMTIMEMAWEAEGNYWYLVGTPYREVLDNVEARIRR